MTPYSPGKPNKLAADFSAETTETTPQWVYSTLFKSSQRKKKLSAKSPITEQRYPSKTKAKQTLPDKQELRELAASRPPSREILNKVL